MTKPRRPLHEILGDDPPSPKAKRGRPVEDHRRQLVLAQAEFTRVKTAKLRGELLDAKEVEAQWASIMADVRQRMLAVPSRIGARLTLGKAGVKIVDEEIREALEALATSGGAPDAWKP